MQYSCRTYKILDCSRHICCQFYKNSVQVSVNIQDDFEIFNFVFYFWDLLNIFLKFVGRFFYESTVSVIYGTPDYHRLKRTCLTQNIRMIL